jgi:hypothetical protein
MDSVRSPSALRTPTLEEVPEDERFDIGDDDGDEIEGVDNDMHNGTPHLDESADQLHQMSEKARGKQPASRVMALSRTTSASSLPTVSTITSQPFRPSQEWLESWYETLPLSTVFKTINEAKIGGGIPEKTTRSIDQAMHAHNDGKFTPGANIELTNTAPGSGSQNAGSFASQQPLRKCFCGSVCCQDANRFFRIYNTRRDTCSDC